MKLRKDLLATSAETFNRSLAIYLQVMLSEIHDRFGGLVMEFSGSRSESFTSFQCPKL
jgi:hypothetical protein